MSEQQQRAGDAHGAWIVARLVAGVEVEEEEVEELWEPWLTLARGVQEANGQGRINVLRTLCAEMPNGQDVEHLVFQQDPRKQPRKRRTPGLLPSLPSAARIAPGASAGAAAWLDEYTHYAKAVSPLTPELFLEASGLWLVSLAIARRLVLRLAHKDLYPNVALLQVAPTTLYAKTTGLGPARYLVNQTMRHLLLPNELTPEALIDELAGKQPAVLEGLNIEDWQKGQKYAAQRGIVLDEASSLFVGMSKDYNIGMGESLLRLYDCDAYISRQTRGTGRSTVRNAYFTFLGATTPWHLKKADIESLWHTGLWPRFLLLTPEKGPVWQRPTRERTQIPAGLQERLRRLCENDLPESTYQEPALPISVGLGDAVFEGYSRYLQATMHDMLVPPTSIDPRLWGVYGRLAEQALKISMLLAALDWNGKTGVPVISLAHWARAQLFVERCRASVHRLPGMLAASTQNEGEAKVLDWLDTSEDEWNTARDIYRALNMKSSDARNILLDLEQSDLVESKQQGRATFYRLKREDEELLVQERTQVS